MFSHFLWGRRDDNMQERGKMNYHHFEIIKCCHTAFSLFFLSATWVSSHVRKVAGGRNKRQQTKWWIDNDERDKMKSTQHPPSIWHPFLAVTWYIRLNSSLKPFFWFLVWKDEFFRDVLIPSSWIQGQGILFHETLSSSQNQ